MLLLLFIFSFFAKAETWPELNQIKSAKNDNIAGAVIIAVEDYVDLPDITGAKQNGDDWYFYFTNVLKLEPKNVRYMVNSDVRKYRVQEEIKTLSEQLKSTEESRQVWVIFIGHGSPSTDNTVRFLTRTAQANVQSIEEEDGLTQDDLLSPFTQNNLDVVAFFDSCFSGLDTSGNALVADLQPFALTRPNVLPKQTIFTATGPGEYAGSLPNLGRPAFSYLALGGLQGWADNNKDGKITASELEQYTQDTFKSFVLGRTQTPQLTTKNREQTLGLGDNEKPNFSEIITNSKNITQTLIKTNEKDNWEQLDIPFNQKKAQRYLSKQCKKKNNPLACYELGKMYHVLRKSSNYKENKMLGENAKYSLNLACFNGVIDSCWLLLDIYNYIIEDEANRGSGIYGSSGYWSQFCEFSTYTFDSSMASFSIAERDICKSHRQMVIQELLPSLEQSCINNSLSSCKMMGDFLFQNNPSEGLPFYIKTCNLGDKTFCRKMGDRMANKENSYFDRGTAVEFYEKACELGDYEACNWAGVQLSFLKKEEIKMNQLYQKSCDQGVSWGCYNVASAYRDGNGGMKKDFDKALKAYKFACDSGIGEACNAGGLVYSDQLYKHKEAYLLYEKACQKDYWWGCHNQGIYLDGYISSSKEPTDYKKAHSLFEKACTNQIYDSCYRLSILYKKGLGGNQDEKKAKELAKKACDGGYKEACN